MIETALTLLKDGLAALTELSSFVEEKSGLPLTITTDVQSATPPCALVLPSRGNYGVNGAAGSCGFSVTLVLPFFGGSVADVLHAADLVGGGLYRATARSPDGTRLTRVEVEEIEETGDRPGVWAVSFFCEFAY